MEQNIKNNNNNNKQMNIHYIAIFFNQQATSIVLITRPLLEKSNLPLPFRYANFNVHKHPLDCQKEYIYIVHYIQKKSS